MLLLLLRRVEPSTPRSKPEVHRTATKVKGGKTSMKKKIPGISLKGGGGGGSNEFRKYSLTRETAKGVEKT